MTLAPHEALVANPCKGVQITASSEEGIIHNPPQCMLNVVAHGIIELPELLLILGHLKLCWHVRDTASLCSGRTH